MPPQESDTQYAIRNTLSQFLVSRISFCVLLVACCLFLLTGCVSPALAQSSYQPASNLYQPAEAFGGGGQSTNTQNTQGVMNSLLNSFAGCMIAGKSLIPGDQCQGEGLNLPGRAQSSLLNQKSALGFIGTGISSISVSPLSTGEALADIGASLGFAKPAYAQNVTGSGSRVIAPVKVLWQVIRNLAYSLYIILFLAVGLMLMFRQKMNPQTVISVQAALPGLIIGLVLITFSYLIAAALVDLAFLFIPLVAIIFDQTGASNIFINNREFWGDNTQFSNFTSLVDLAQNANIFTFWKAFTLNIALYDFFGNTNQGWGSLDIAKPLETLLTIIIEAGKNGLNLIVAVVAIFALFIQMIRLFAMLVRAYITIMVYTFLGPFLIIMSSIPGRGKGVQDWWKTIMANSLIFPAVFGGFFFAGMIFDPKNIDQTQFQYTMPFFSGFPVQVIKYIIGFMILLGIPAIPGMVKEAFGVKDIKGIPEMAMQGFGTGGEIINKGFTRFTGIDAIKKEREALREQILRQKFSSADELAHLARPGWLGGLRDRFVSIGQPSYVKNAIRTAADASRASGAPSTSSGGGH